MGEKSKTNILTSFELAKIHWKSQALAHFIIGIPMGTLTVLFWGVSVKGVIGVAVYYFFLYIFIYFPIYGILPEYTLRAVKGTLSKLDNKEYADISKSQYRDLIQFFIALPSKSIPSVMFLEISAFVMGALFWKTGYVPELLPILNVATLETIVLGVVVSLSAALLNFAFIESKASETIQLILQNNPHVLKEGIKTTKISLSRKLFILITVTTIIAVFSILLFFTSYLIITTPEKVVVNLIFISIVLTSSMTFLIVLAPIISQNVTRPLKLLINWSQKVSEGDLKSRINYITNDEITDLINDSNTMIEDLERTGKQVETEKNKLSTVIAEIAEGIITLDTEFSIILINKMAQAMLGYPEAEVLNKKINEMAVIIDASEDNTSIEQELADLYSKKKEDAFTKGNYRVVKTGKYITIKARSFISAFDQKVYFILTLRDVTSAMSLEEMRLDFVSMAAHELRTPLTSIRGYVDIFLEEYRDKIEQEGIVELERAASAAKRLSELVDNLLNVSKIERGNFEMNIEEASWINLVKGITDQLKVNGKNKNIEVELIEPHEISINVKVDKIRISEVLSNLITNAINYTPEGGKVWVSVEVSDNKIITHVRDNGPGIAAEAQAHIFTKFYRAKRSLEQGVYGTGLGLFMSKSIVEMHQGKIWFSSELGKGSTFSFSLPIASNT